jgi:hypothetical protein
MLGAYGALGAKWPKTGSPGASLGNLGISSNLLLGTVHILSADMVYLSVMQISVTSTTHSPLETPEGTLQY